MPKNLSSDCNPPEDFGEGAIEDFRPFSISWWVLTFDLVCKDCLNARFLVTDKVLATKPYAVFWDIPIPGCVLIVFNNLFSLGCWSCLSFYQEILESIPVLCLPIE